MGTKIFDIVSSDEITLKELSGKKLAIDSYLYLYQFLSTIRLSDGSLLTDSKGRVTSHINGLFYRTVNLLKNNIKPIFVFDGKAPDLKRQEVEKRINAKKEAMLKYNEAKLKDDIVEMKKYASRTSKLTKEMIEEAKELVRAFGCPVVQAASEGEAQAAYLSKKGEVWAVASQDADSMLFGAKRLIRNITISGKRKIPGKIGYKNIKPEYIELSRVFNELGIDNDQLIVLAMLVGTDYNPKGIKGIGQKTALKKVREFGKDFEALFEDVKWSEQYDIDWQDIFYLFKNIPVSDDYDLEFKQPDFDKISEIMLSHDFSQERLDSNLSKLKVEKQNQSDLSRFF